MADEARVKPSVPELSVVLTAPSGFEPIRGVWRHLRSQSAAPVMEIVIVAPVEPGMVVAPEERAGFWDVRIVLVDEYRGIAKGNAEGIRQACAEVVVLAEDHAYPEPDWAEALIQAHAGPWTVVGPVMVCANPKPLVSRADFLIAYGHWADPADRLEVDFLPGHNSSYKREALLAYGEALDSLLEAEIVLHWDLGRNGHRLLLEPAARVRHLNFARFFPWLRVQFLCGRVFAASRSRSWETKQRIFHACTAPMIPFRRLWDLHRSRPPSRRPFEYDARLVSMLLAGWIADSAGEFLGNAIGAGSAGQRIWEYEHGRIRFT